MSKTQNEILGNMFDSLSANNPNINPYTEGGFFNIYLSPIAGAIAGMYDNNSKLSYINNPALAGLDALEEYTKIVGISPRKVGDIATGTIALAFDNNTTFNTPTINIPVGTQLVWGGLIYELQEYIIINTANLLPTYYLNVSAIAVGTRYNVIRPAPFSWGEDYIKIFNAFITSGGYILTNSDAIEGGKDQETLANLSSRVLHRLRQPIDNGTVTAHISACLEIPEVVYAVPRLNTISGTHHETLVVGTNMVVGSSIDPSDDQLKGGEISIELSASAKSKVLNVMTLNSSISENNVVSDAFITYLSAPTVNINLLNIPVLPSVLEMDIIVEMRKVFLSTVPREVVKEGTVSDTFFTVNLRPL